MLVAFIQMIPTFALLAYFTSLEKALVASTVIWSIWVAVTARKEGWQMRGFWWVVAGVAAMNAIAIWLITLTDKFDAGLPVAYPLGMAEGFGVYWLLGWWLRRESSVR